MTNTSQADQLEREIARQLEVVNERARADARIEERRASRQAQALVQKQAEERVKAMLNNPVVKHQTQLPAQSEAEVKQKKLQLEQPQQPEELAKRFDDHMVEVNALLASLGGKPIIKGKIQHDTPAMESQPDTDSAPTLSADDQYKQTIVTKMIALIKQRKMK